MKFLNIFIPGVILLIPLGEILRIDLGNEIYLKPLDFFAVITAIVFLFTRIIQKKKLVHSKIEQSFLYFAAFSIFALLINSSRLSQAEFITSFLYWLRFVCIGSIYFSVKIIEKKVRGKIPLFLYISGSAFLLIGLVQYFLYPNLRNLYYLGWDEHNFRLFSSFLDPNFAGSMLVLFLVFQIGYALSLAKKHQIGLLYLNIFISLLTVVAVFLTYSRSAILMFVVSIIIYLILIKRKIIILFFIALLSIVFVLIFPTFNTENTNLLRRASSMSRIDSYIASIKIIKENPIFGIGFNAYRYFNTSDHDRKESNYQNHSGSGGDSSLLFVAATTGIVGLSTYIYVWYLIITRAFILWKNKSNYFALVVIVSCAGLFINSFFINSLFFPSIMVWMWIIIGVMDNN